VCVWTRDRFTRYWTDIYSVAARNNPRANRPRCFAQKDARRPPSYSFPYPSGQLLYEPNDIYATFRISTVILRARHDDVVEIIAETNGSGVREREREGGNFERGRRSRPSCTGPTYGTWSSSAAVSSVSPIARGRKRRRWTI